MGTGGEIFAKNIEALGVWNPQAAALFSCAVIPAGWERVTGSDGAQTFRQVIEDSPRRVEWLGGTSLPSAAATALTADMDAGTGTAMGLGIGTGYEWKALCTRLGSHQAVFVLEPDAAACRMVLAVCDLSGLLAAGKLVVVAGDGAAEQLLAFLRKHVGFDVPSVMHVLQSVPLEKRNALRAAAEAMIRRAIGARTALGAELLAKMSGYAPAAGGPVVGFTATGSRAGERVLGEALKGMRARGREVVELVADHHASTSLVGRLEVLARHRPAVVWADFYRGQLGLPGELSRVAVHTWVPPGAGVGYFSPERLGGVAGADRVVVHSVEHREVLEGLGIGREKIDMVAVGVGEVAQDADGIRAGVGMIGDVPALDAGAYGFELPSHLAVWEAARKLIMEEPFEAYAHRAADLFRRAQRAAGVSIEDAKVAEPMERAIRHGLMRAAVWVAVARLLIEAGLPVRLIGRGWESHGLKASVVGFGTPTEMFDGLAAVLQVHPAGMVDPLVLAAAGSGVAVVAVEHPRDGEIGGVAKLLEPAKECWRVRGRDLVGTLKQVLRDAGARGVVATAGGRRVREEHLWVRRELTQ